MSKISMDGLEEVLRPFEPQSVVKVFFDLDKDGKLFQFLHERLHGRMPEKLTKCRDGESANVGLLSAAIRHIFVHGHLASRSNGVSPARLSKACKTISDFLLRFMDLHFEQRIDAYCTQKGITL